MQGKKKLCMPPTYYSPYIACVRAAHLEEHNNILTITGM